MNLPCRKAIRETGGYAEPYEGKSEASVPRALGLSIALTSPICRILNESGVYLVYDWLLSNSDQTIQVYIIYDFVYILLLIAFLVMGGFSTVTSTYYFIYSVKQDYH